MEKLNWTTMSTMPKNIHHEPWRTRAHDYPPVVRDVHTHVFSEPKVLDSRQSCFDTIKY